MHVTLISKSAFSVVGKLGRGPANAGPEWIPPLWKAANEQFDRIRPMVKFEADAPAGLWGLMSDAESALQPWNEVGLYLAGCETECACEPPEGFHKWTIPAQTYLVIDCEMAEYAKVFDAALNGELPARGLRLAGAVHERYPDPRRADIVELWFPVEQNS